MKVSEKIRLVVSIIAAAGVNLVCTYMSAQDTVKRNKK